MNCNGKTPHSSPPNDIGPNLDQPRVRLIRAVEQGRPHASVLAARLHASSLLRGKRLGFVCLARIESDLGMHGAARDEARSCWKFLGGAGRAPHGV